MDLGRRRPDKSDFFDCHDGTATDTVTAPTRAAVLDAVFDVSLALDRRNKLVARAEAGMSRQQVLVVGVEAPGKVDALHRITQRLAQSRHGVVVSTAPMRAKGKFANIDDAIATAGRPLPSFDWLIITDDDIALPQGFTDRYLAIAELAGLIISQPAHKFRSHTTYQLTRRRFGTLARRTHFVEAGPLTVIRRPAFAELVPFPPSRWAYGIDVLWADLAWRRGWTMGVVDALAIRHLRPVGTSYDMAQAIEEGRTLVEAAGVKLNRSDLFAKGEELITAGMALPREA